MGLLSFTMHGIRIPSTSRVTLLRAIPCSSKSAYLHTPPSSFRRYQSSSSSSSSSSSTFIPGSDIIQPTQLRALLSNPKAKLRILDVGSSEAYTRAHIPTSYILPVIGPLTKDPESRISVLPSSSLEAIAADVGITGHQDEHIVVYDNGQGWAAAYVWWTFRYYGLRNISMLDGGWPRYVELGNPISVRTTTTTTPTTTPPPDDVGVFVAQPNRKLITTADEVLDLVQTGSTRKSFTSTSATNNNKKKDITTSTTNSNDDSSTFITQILDARTPGEYVGIDLRGNIRGGHIPGAINLSHTELLNTGTDGSLKSPEELRKIFTNNGIDLTKPIVSYCQMGMRGALALLALRVAGHSHPESLSNYDGSMKEWLNNELYPVEK